MKITHNLEKYGTQTRIHILKKLAEKGQRTVMNHIIYQDLAWLALSERRKKEKGHDRILEDSKTLLNNIKGVSNEDSAMVGVPSSVTYPDGTSLAQVAYNNEYGSSNTPVRKLWKPSVDELRIWQQTGVNNPSKILYYLLKNV
jgi:hypothetical protein